MNSLAPIKTALISVSDKTNLIPLARSLSSLWNVKLISTGGTAKLLQQANINVSQISSLTNFPESFDGRVKSLHPKIHGAILMDHNSKKHQQQAKNLHISPIDMVVVNFYPFQKIAAQKTNLNQLLDNIDIGGPTMLRAAAKNYRFVTTLFNPNAYQEILDELKLHNGKISLNTREKFALAAFAHSAQYETTIQTSLSLHLQKKSPQPTTPLHFQNLQILPQSPLRYGENPHQKAVLLKTNPPTSGWSLPHSKLLAGKPMSYNNFLDAEAAVNTVFSLQKILQNQSQPKYHTHITTIVKHGNPCGLAVAESPKQALQIAWQGDPTSAFGSVLALNCPLDDHALPFFEKKFIEVVVAPKFHQNTLNFFSNNKKFQSLRLLQLAQFSDPTHNSSSTYLRSISGGILAQEIDALLFPRPFSLKSVTDVIIPQNDFPLYAFSLLAASQLKSNAVAVGVKLPNNQLMLLAIGSGQPNRVECITKLIAPRLNENLEKIMSSKLAPHYSKKNLLNNCVLASDAFFPFPDAVDAAYSLGIRKIIQPGGSVRDKDVVQKAQKYNIAMAFSQYRHFLH